MENCGRPLAITRSCSLLCARVFVRPTDKNLRGIVSQSGALLPDSPVHFCSLADAKTLRFSHRGAPWGWPRDASKGAGARRRRSTSGVGGACPCISPPKTKPTNHAKTRVVKGTCAVPGLPLVGLPLHKSAANRHGAARLTNPESRHFWVVQSRHTFSPLRYEKMRRSRPPSEAGTHGYSPSFFAMKLQKKRGPHPRVPCSRFWVCQALRIKTEKSSDETAGLFLIRALTVCGARPNHSSVSSGKKLSATLPVCFSPELTAAWSAPGGTSPPHARFRISTSCWRTRRGSPHASPSQEKNCPRCSQFVFFL